MGEKVPNICQPMVASEPDWICKTCAFRKKDLFDGQVKGFSFDMCMVFPDCKPYGVKYEHKKCPYYVEGDPE